MVDVAWVKRWTMRIVIYGAPADGVKIFFCA
jgi:hypothetical protein